MNYISQLTTDRFEIIILCQNSVKVISATTHILNVKTKNHKRHNILNDVLTRENITSGNDAGKLARHDH